VEPTSSDKPSCYKSKDPAGFIRFILCNLALKFKGLDSSLQVNKLTPGTRRGVIELADFLEKEAARLRGIIRDNGA